MGAAGNVAALPFLSPRAATYGAIRADNMDALDTALRRLAPADFPLFLSEAITTGQQNYLAAEHIVDYTEQYYAGNKPALWSKMLAIILPPRGVVAPDQLGLIRKLIRYGGRPSPAALEATIRSILLTLNWSQPDPAYLQLLRAFYEAGGGPYIPATILDAVFQDAGQWTLLRHPGLWARLPRDLAEAGEQARMGIRGGLAAVLNDNLAQYVLRVL